jgi:signal transduction histidine kinase/ActR/RegA family two-component response regulator
VDVHEAESKLAFLNPWRYVRRSVRGKLAGIIILTTIIVLLVSGIAMLAHDLHVYRSSWVADVSSEARLLALSTAPALAFDDRDTAQRNLNSLEGRSAVLAAGLYTSTGDLYADFHRSGESPPPARSPATTSIAQVSGERVEIVQPIEHNGEYLGSLYVRARYDVMGRVRAYLGIFSLITLLSLLAAFALSKALQRVITVPLEDIGQVARQIVHQHDYSLRPKQTTEDEIGLVVQAFNGMLDEVQARTAALQESNAALRETDRRKDEFLATLAHELRNPLAPIRHATQLLHSEVATEAQRKWGREVIARQVANMALLLEDLLDVSRISRGRLEIRKDYVSLENVVASAVETARPLVESKRHRLEVNVPEEPLDLNIDSLRMSQALSNLLTNAAKYTDPGGVITLSARREAAGVVISVRDTGIGLSEKAIPQVFEMFSQVESALERSQGGLGIGLALVKGIVSLHGGTVHAASDGIGRGSTFTIRLPDSCLPQPMGSRSPDGEPGSATRSQPCRVLVADDNQDAARALATILNLSGHEVFVTTSGREAMTVAAREHPEAVILDIGMPDLSGYGVAEWIRKQPWASSVLLIALTGWGQRDDVDRALAAGFDLHFTKPADVGEIEERLAEFCAKKNVVRLSQVT